MVKRSGILPVLPLEFSARWSVAKTINDNKAAHVIWKNWNGIYLAPYKCGQEEVTTEKIKKIKKKC